MSPVYNCLPFLENVLKSLHDDALGKLQIYTHSVCQWVPIVCTPLPPFPTKFSEKWQATYRISIFRRGGFFGGGERGLQFLYKKQKLKSEIFNEKKGLLPKNVFLYLN